jgi:hypothetical protein
MKPHNTSSQQQTKPLNPSRRDFVRKAAYIAPVVVTLSVLPAHQAAGSIRNGNNGVGNGVDPQPPGDPPFNDPVGSGPGNPNNHP